MNSLKPKNPFSFKFVLERGLSGRELIAVHAWCVLNKVNITFQKTGYITGSDEIPVGSVEFVETALQKTFIPDYYPKFASSMLGRKVWHSDYCPSKACFVKPDVYKAFTGYIKGKTIGDGGSYLGGYWCSEIVKFDNEWRFYIADGKILEVGWYQGSDEFRPVPKIDGLDLTGVCGALDIGETLDGKFLLVEFHHPFAIGWYGEDRNAYVDFLIKGWEVIK